MSSDGVVADPAAMTRWGQRGIHRIIILQVGGRNS
eukprot:CAMPEP_0206827174 /NCGR_PEP_ID=MMETSP0975-20121206/15215_1 /ASSEMBLY_ACC=CAM_ASM_000399 /TAXON_ID=483370 /ORGANISM="non described non described, Strain CCMP2097" /LENGTH=34 /DNA_ID= /DNA_START= /DNA_END= /DNA_ORIENTATION=